MKTVNIFPHLTPHSRVWIYTSNKQIDHAIVPFIEQELRLYVSEWTAHAEKVKADAGVFYNYFIILAADESQVKVSGCSIDSSVHFIQRLAEKYDLNLFDRFFTVYLHDGRLSGADRETLQQLIYKGEVSADTMVFNNTIQTLHELRNKWLVPMHNSWHFMAFDFPEVITGRSFHR
jgi:hypothetical protein